MIKQVQLFPHSVVITQHKNIAAAASFLATTEKKSSTPLRFCHTRHSYFFFSLSLLQSPPFFRFPFSLLFFLKKKG